MDISKIYLGIEENLNEIEPALRAQEAKVAQYEVAMEKLMADMEAAETELKIIKGRHEALIRAKEALETAEFPLVKEEPKKEEVTEKTETKEKSIKGGSLKWTHKDAMLVRFDRYDKVLDKHRNQSAAARDLGWTQSGLSRFLKFDKESQIRRKNFYFKWEY